MGQIDWSQAPADAQFHSFGSFRKHDCEVEYYWNDEEGWTETRFDCIDWHREQPDFEMRPESSEPEWNGQGFPPVGTVCGIKYTDGKWGEVTITVYGKHHVIFEDSNGNERVEYLNGIELRPIKSDKDKWIELAKKENRELPIGATEQEMFERLYDAIKSGKLPTP